MLGFNDTSTLWVILCRPPKKGGRKKEKVAEMKERDRGEEENEWKGWAEEEIKTFPLYPCLLQGSRPCPTISNISWTPL